MLLCCLHKVVPIFGWQQVWTRWFIYGNNATKMRMGEIHLSRAKTFCNKSKLPFQISCCGRTSVFRKTNLDSSVKLLLLNVTYNWCTVLVAQAFCLIAVLEGICLARCSWWIYRGFAWFAGEKSLSFVEAIGSLQAHLLHFLISSFNSKDQSLSIWFGAQPLLHKHMIHNIQLR